MSEGATANIVPVEERTTEQITELVSIWRETDDAGEPYPLLEMERIR